MPSFLHKLWTSSPDQISRALIGRLTGRHKPIQRPAPEWHRMTAGPLEGCELLLAPSLAAAWREMISGAYEPFMLQSIKEHLDLKGAVVWDVGAHIGFHSLCFASEVGEHGAVVSFEPTAASHERLQKNIDRNQSLKGRIRAFNMALSDKRGTLSFVYSDGVDIRNTASHFCDVIPPSEDSEYEDFKTTTVPTDSVDDLIQTENLPPPDVLKIDVEGAEFLVLQGARKTLGKKRPHLLMEVHNISMMFETQRLLHELNYEMILIDEENTTVSRAFFLAKPLS
jgi:FkbM family methyltransferase